MTPLGIVLASVLGLATFVVVAYTAFFIWVYFTYRENIYRIFEAKPMFFPPAALPHPEAENVSFVTKSGRSLRGSYLRHTAGERKGVLLFCHEYSATRWLCDPYLGPLRADGYDIFAFDFCNHGESDSIVGYDPLQWVTEYEVEDVQAAVEYMKRRADAPKSGIGIFGVSKGGGAAIATAAKEPWIKAIATDGAFPAHETVTHYEMRWVGIYVVNRISYKLWPRKFYAFLATCVIASISKKHGVQYVRLERSLRRLGRRPLFMIHGEKDNYINPDIVRRFFAFANEPKELWFVPKAKHNGCVDIAGEEYHRRLLAFFNQALGG